MERSAIHVLHKRGLSQRRIARELGINRETVGRVLTEGVNPPPLHRRRPSLVDPYREQIAGWVSEGLSGARMLELARRDPERPYRGGHSVFRTAVREARLAARHEATVAAVPVRFEGLPAEYLQVDWGEVARCPFTRHPPGRRYFLACRLKYSRWTWVRFTTDMRQETLLRGLIDCCAGLGWVPWVVVFDNMKVVTSGRDTEHRPVWTAALLHVAAELGFHPEACTPGAANQKGSVESLVKYVKGNFLAGRTFADDADLADQLGDWQRDVNSRPSRATGTAPDLRLAEEAPKGGVLPDTVHDYGFFRQGTVSREAMVAVEGNQYSVPIVHVGAPVTVRLHRDRVVLWRETQHLATHKRAPDGAHRRIVEPAHFALLFARKPRAQVMLYRQALVDLGPAAAAYVGEVSHRQRAHLRAEILDLYALLQQHGPADLLAAMELATQANAYGAAYLQTLLAGPTPAAEPPTRKPATPPLALPGIPGQAEVDRRLVFYEAYVQQAGDAAAVEAGA